MTATVRMLAAQMIVAARTGAFINVAPWLSWPRVQDGYKGEPPIIGNERKPA